MNKLLIALLFLSSTAAAKQPSWMPFGGLYFDTINKFNARAGVGYVYDWVEFSDDFGASFDHANFVFADLLAGADTHGVGIGWGIFLGEGNVRLSGSYIEGEDESYAGIEGTFTAFFIASKQESIKRMIQVVLSL